MILNNPLFASDKVKWLKQTAHQWNSYDFIERKKFIDRKFPNDNSIIIQMYTLLTYTSSRPMT